MEEKQHILKLLQNVDKALKEKNYIEIKNLSNQIIHTASIYQDPDSIAIAVVIYSLSKLIERESYKEEKNWTKFYEEYIKNIEFGFSYGSALPGSRNLGYFKTCKKRFKGHFHGYFKTF